MYIMMALIADRFYYICLLTVILNYIFSSSALYVLAKRRGIESPGCAWIPVGTDWIIGKLTDDYDFKNKRDFRFGKIMFALLTISLLTFAFMIFLTCTVVLISLDVLFIKEVTYVATCLVIVLTLVIILTWVVRGIFKVICIYKIFKSTVPEMAVIFTILYYLTPCVVGSICLYVSRNKGYSFDNRDKKEVISEGIDNIS